MRRLFLAFLLLTTIALPALGTPAVTGAVLNISTGQMVVTGTGFGSKSPAAPVFYQPFTTTSQGDTFLAAGWDFLGGNVQDAAHNFVEMSTGVGTGAGSWTNLNDNSGAETFTHFGIFLPPSNDAVFTTYFRRMIMGASGSPVPPYNGQIKQTRTGPTGGNNGQHDGALMYGYHWAQMGGSNNFPVNDPTNPCCGDPVGQWWSNGNGVPNNVLPPGVPGIAVADGSFHYFETYFQLNTLGNADAIMYQRIDENEYINVNNLQPRTNAGEYLEYVQPNPGYAEQFANQQYTIYFSHIYIDTTRTHVFLGNASSLSSVTGRFAIPASSWSTTSATVSDAGIAPSGYNWVYVEDSNGAINATGFAFTTTGGSAVNYRKTFSPVGGRVGKRQVH